MEREQITKKDLNNLKTELLDQLVDKKTYKKDMAKLATKEELAEAVSKLATKEEQDKIKKSLERLTGQVVKNIIDISELKEQMKDVHKKLDTILISIDGITKILTDMQSKKAATESTFRRHENWLTDHETRIAHLEQKTV